MALLTVSRRIGQEIREFIGSPRFDPEAPPATDAAWPRITIITPSFNQAPFLERTIWSIHNQGYKNLEHIVIDGGSSDGSVKILEKYHERFSYWHSRSDHGQCDAINQGAEKATGLFMTWINSDDILIPGSLHTIGRLIRDNPDTDMFYGNQVEVDATDKVTKRIYTIDFDLRDFLYEINIIIHQQSAFWKVELFRELEGLNDCPYAMDYDLFYRMISRGMRWHRVDDFLSAFRMYPDSLTGSGEVRRSRAATVDGIFLQAMGRRRNLWDRTVMKYLYKTKRFLTEPRALVAAMEHRVGQLLSK